MKIRKFILSIFCASFYVFGLVDNISADTINLTPTDDAHVKSGSPANNYGEATNLITSDYDSNIETTFIKFDLTSLSGQLLTGAEITLVPILDRGVSKVVKIVSSSNWQEESVDWNTKPIAGGVIGNFTGNAVVGESVTITLDYTQIQPFLGSFVTIMFDNTGTSDTFSVSSKEGANPPELVLYTSSSQVQGDANDDGRVDGLDYIIWRNNYGQVTNLGPAAGDFNNSGDVDGVDYIVWVQNYGTVPISPTPTGLPTFTPTTTPTPSPTQTVTPTPTPSPGPVGEGIWISPEEIRSLPIAGQSGCTSGSLCYEAWNDIVAKAQSDWGTPDLSRYAGLNHSQGIYAGALVAVRCAGGACSGINDSAMRTKVLDALNSVVGTEQAALPPGISGEHLAPERQFPRYAIAADLLGVNDWENGYRGYDNFVDYMANTRFAKVNGDFTFAESHDNAASNGNTMAGFARVVSDIYLGDNSDLDAAWLTFRRYTGDRSVGPDLDFNSYAPTWMHNTSAPVAINPLNSYRDGYYVDGVIPNDQGRGGDRPTNPDVPPTYASGSQYPWEGLQGIYAQALIFDRLGYSYNGQSPWQLQNQALLRAVQYQWHLRDWSGDVRWYDAGRASWVKHLAYVVYGYRPIEYSPSDGGRNISYTQWTHPN